VHLGPPADAGAYAHEIRVVRSDDGGKTFAAPVKIPTDALSCVSHAIDAGNPDVLYVVHLAGSGGAEGHVRLLVSEDGGKTFPTERTIGATVNGGLGMICPDITSPKPGTVLITAERTAGGDKDHWTGTFVAGNNGKDFPAPDSSDPYYAPDTNATPAADFGCAVESNGEQRSPRVFSDGNGRACMVYGINPGETCNDGSTDVYAQCSIDAGLTWSAPQKIGNSGPTKLWPTGAFSADGKKVAFTWTFNPGNGADDEIAFIVSEFKDTVPVFAPPRTYPIDRKLLETNEIHVYTADPILGWQGSDILWLGQTIYRSDTPIIVVDKTCDDGATWSGAVKVTNPNDFDATSIIETANGVAVVGFGIGNGSAQPETLFPLTP
jgi:hypothetical protein